MISLFFIKIEYVVKEVIGYVNLLQILQNREIIWQLGKMVAREIQFFHLLELVKLPHQAVNLLQLAEAEVHLLRLRLLLEESVQILHRYYFVFEANN